MQQQAIYLRFFWSGRERVKNVIVCNSVNLYNPGNVGKYSLSKIGQVYDSNGQVNKPEL